jgi:predicted RNA polymerase sigma factor
LLRRLERWGPATEAYRRAAELAATDADRTFLREQIEALAGDAPPSTP